MPDNYLQPKTQREAILDMHHDVKDMKEDVSDLKTEIYGNGTGRGLIKRLDSVEEKIDGKSGPKNGDKKGKWIVRFTLITLAVTMVTEKIPDILKWLGNLFP